MLLEKETDLVRDLGKKIVDREIDRFNKKKKTSSGITLSNNEIKYIIKVIKSY